MSKEELIEGQIKRNVFLTTVDKIYNWGRRSSMWPVAFGLACCAFEFIATGMARYDLSRFGMEIMRPSPRQADLMIVAGTITHKMAPQVLRIYNQMPEPKYVLAMGNCAISGGPFPSYAVLQGAAEILPVDVYVPGCPPRPEALLEGIMKLHDMVMHQSIKTVPWYKEQGSRGAREQGSKE